MDFQILGEDTLKVKSKKVSLAVDPRSSVSKFDAEAIVSTDGNFDSSRINDFRVIISGPGEYEVSGVKISGIKSGGLTVYEFMSDNTSVLIAKASALSDISQDRLGDHKIVVINADSPLNVSAITAMEPSAVLLYGANKKEGAKQIDGASSNVSSKISLSEDKLPEELEVMVLG